MGSAQGLVNPYTVGEPVVDENLFFGRDNVLAWARKVLGARGTRRVVVIQGSYRIGKSSLLNQLHRHLPQRVFLIDLSALERDRLDYLLWRVASSILSTLRREKAVRLSEPEVNDYLSNPNHFHETFLPQVYKALRRKRLVLAFDEVTALEGGPGSLREAFYAYLSVVMESGLNLSLVLAVEEWPERPLPLFEDAFRWRLGPLDDDASRELIVGPAKGVLQYDYHATKRITELSSGHPYFVQLLCQVMFDRYAVGGRVSGRDVDRTVEEVTGLGSAYVERMWSETSPKAKIVLSGFAALHGAHGILLERDLSFLLIRSGARLSLADISRACAELVDRDLLEELGAKTYRFRVELVRLLLGQQRSPESVVGMGRARRVTVAASDWMGKFLWPLIGLLVVTSGIFGVLLSSRPSGGGSGATATAVGTESPSTLSFVLVTPTPGRQLTPVSVPTLPSLMRDEIVYMLWDPDAGNWEIYTMSADGSVVTRLTDSDADDTSPAWSQDHRWLVFVSERDGNQEIYRMNADGSEPLNLSSNPAPDWTPSVSPDGTKIVFASLRDGNWELYLMDADGSQLARMTFNQSPDYSPAWSPDGSRIAFVSERDGNLEIYVMPADGSEEVRLTSNNALDLSAAWSPDGSSIAFESYRDGNMEIYVMNADGTDQRNLTSYPAADDHGPSWTDDGLGIVFYSNRDGNWDLYLMNAQGGEARNLTDSRALEQEPFWGT